MSGTFTQFTAMVDGATRRALLELKRLIDALTAGKAATEYSSLYVPTLTGMAVGTGGASSNVANYTFVGGPAVGDRGIITVIGSAVYGDTGRTFPTSPTFSLPPGFQLASANNLRPIGLAYLGDFGTGVNDRNAAVYINDASSVRLILSGWTAALANITTTFPFTWAAGDSMHYQYTFAAVRV